MKNYYVPIIFFQLVIITYLSLITVDIRWEIRSGFKTQEKLNAENEEIENLQMKVAKKLGYELVNHRMELFGKKILKKN